MLTEGEVKEVKFQFGPYTFFPRTRRVLSAAGSSVLLTKLESRMLKLAAEGNGGVVPKDMLFRDTYAERDRKPGPKLLDVKICQIRKKLNELPPHNGGEHIVTIWGRGYRLSQTPVRIHDSLTRERDPLNRGLLARLEAIAAASPQQA